MIGSVSTDDRLAECIYKKRWAPRPNSSSKTSQVNGVSSNQKVLSAEDDAKLIFGSIFSLRNMVKKLAGPEDKCVQIRKGPKCYEY